MLILSEASDFTGGSHLNAENWVGSSKTGEREHRRFDGRVVLRSLPLLGISERDVLHVLAHHHLGGGLDEVKAHGLGDERHGAGGTEVALDNHAHVLLDDELDVERASDVQGLGNAPGVRLDPVLHEAGKALRREQQRGVTRVHARVLHVLVDGRHHDLSLVGHGVHLDLLGSLDELGDHHGVVLGDVGRLGEEVSELLVILRDVHGGAGEHVARAHEHGVADAVGELDGLVEVGHLAPRGLLHADGVHERGELVAVLGRVDHVGVRAEDVDVGRVEVEGQVVRDLAADAHHDAVGALEVVDVEHALLGELLEVELVALVVVRGDGLGVVVDHHGALAEAAERADARNGAPVELNRASDAVCPRTEDDGAASLDVNVVFLAMVSHVQVVRLGRVFSGEGVNLLGERHDTEALTEGPNFHLSRVGELGDLLVAETELLQPERRVFIEVAEFLLLGLLGRLDDVHEPREEPLVDVGELVDLVHGVALVVHGVRDGVHAAVAGLDEFLVEVVLQVGSGARFITIVGWVDHAKSLLEALLQGTADGHDLSDRLHRRSNLRADALELTKVPSRHLGDDVVEGRLEAGLGGLGDRVADLREGDTERELSGNKRERVAGGLGGKG
mmetsp:Transcript_12334/g.25097  ORF Transcript_12334/g.25097 Transcript_12334/m.25097 type:complete len:618 (+) Transcript_12334:774-2627(+)